MNKYKSIIKKLKNMGVVFANGLTKEEFEKIENIYSIKFPKELKEFLSLAMPFDYYTTTLMQGEQSICRYTKPFSIWNDFSTKNIDIIKKWIAEPKNSLKNEYKNAKKDKNEFNILLNDLGINNENDIKAIDKEFKDFVENKLENTIPIFAHRYILQRENSPVLSVYKSDDICIYGENLYDYLNCEFFNKLVPNDLTKLNLGYWHEVVLR